MYKIYEEKIKNLFENYKSQDPELQKIINRKYVYSQFHTGRKVLFIGLNPSFREKQAKKEEYYKSFDATNNNADILEDFLFLQKTKTIGLFLTSYILEKLDSGTQKIFIRENLTLSNNNWKFQKKSSKK